MTFESILTKNLKKCYLGNIDFRKACHNIDIENDIYKLILYSDAKAVFQSITDEKRNIIIMPCKKKKMDKVK